MFSISFSPLENMNFKCITQEVYYLQQQNIMPPIKLKCATPKKRKKKKSLPSLCRQSSRRFENRSPLHLTSQLQDFVLNLLSQFALGGHSTTMWTKFYPIMTPSPLKWTIVVILHDTFPFPMSLVFHKKSYLVCHRSLVGYLPQVKNSKNCPTGYY